MNKNNLTISIGKRILSEANDLKRTIKSLSKEIASRGITANCISPGFIETDFISDLTDKQRETYKALVPLKRFGKPEEVANTVLFLASKETSYITGTTIEVSGGL